MVETKDFTINLPEDVGRFFFWLVFDCKINFHPDDNFADYVCEATGETTFNDKQADMYNEVMDECFKVCEQYQRDIYEIAFRTFKLYHYCDGNDTLANMGEGE
ncbi:MAG: hypothetical protein IJ551_09870 [Prevotella sp.]|nr:hypothetical protein [Prevotella sp.]